MGQHVYNEIGAALKTKKTPHALIVRTAILPGDIQAVGSWFNPSWVEPRGGLPFWPYIDQSCSPTIDEGDVAGQKSMRTRLAFTTYQGQTYRDAHGIFCMSNWAREQTLAAHRLPASNVHYVGGAMLGRPLRRGDAAQRSRPLCSSGTISTDKGADVLVAAAGIVTRRMRNARFIPSANTPKIYDYRLTTT